MIKTTIVSALALVGMAIAAQAQAQATDLYMVGHEDDWQLFMGHKAFDHIATANPITFIYLTAGDAGYGTGGWGNVGMFKARENGAIASTMEATATIPQWYPADVKQWKTFNNHRIWTVRHRNTMSYFLRLPDGAPDGNGYAATGNTSVTKLRNGQIASISAIDNSTTYKGYGDLVRTIQAILNQSSPGVMHGTEIDFSINPNTHPDHRAATLLAMDAFDGYFSGYELWQDYTILDRPSNLDQDGVIKKTMLFGGLCHQMSVDGYNLVFESWHASFLSRYAYRTTTSPYPGGFGKKKI